MLEKTKSLPEARGTKEVTTGSEDGVVENKTANAAK